MEFKKYQHIERLGTTETDGIEIGTAWVFPKIDGTNSSLWWNNGIQAGSRNRHLTLDDDNAGFYEWALKQDNLKTFFTSHPALRLYGEWLVPHTLKTYEESAWRNFYVFDVRLDERYLPFEEYRDLLEPYNINVIPPICKVKNPTTDRLVNQLEKNGYLIKDGEGLGEGVVIKNYDYKNKHGRVIWAKIVRNDFKAKHWSNEPGEIKERKEVEQEIADKYITTALVEKEFAKIKNEDGWSSKFIPRLLGIVYYSLVKEETWNFVKEFKNPRIDFRRLNTLSIQRIKELKPEIF
jgi:hypothetical protein